MPISKSPTQTALSWWLSGDEECPHCHQLYAYEIEVRCPACDGPSCPHCVALHVERGIVCMVCRDDHEQIEESSGGR